MLGAQNVTNSPPAPLVLLVLSQRSPRSLLAASGFSLRPTNPEVFSDSPSLAVISLRNSALRVARGSRGNILMTFKS